MTRWSIRFASAPVVAGVLSYAPWLALLGVLSYLSWFMTDDAFIAFRYVRNFMEGHGLVFNPGERVEGYSSFLWVLELAAIWKIFGLPPEDVAQWLSVGYTAGVIALLLWWVRRDATLRNRGLAGWMALGLVCGSATFAVWTSGGGLETRQFTFFVMAAIIALSVHNGSRWGLLAASFGLAGASLTRPEGILIAACCFGWFCLSRTLADRRRSDASPGSALHPDSIAWRRLVAWVDWREIACLIGPFVVLVSAHLAFRLVYYGEWLPNTYYAKIVRPWYGAGFRYYLAAAVDTGLYILVPLAFLALRARWRSRRDIAYALPLLCIFVHVLGVMRIGGDHFGYRPLDFYWPALSVPVSAAILDLGSRVSGARFWRPIRRPLALGANACSLLIFAPVIFYCSAIQGLLLLAGARTINYTGNNHIEIDEEKGLLNVPGMAVLVSISNDLRRLAVEQRIAVPFAKHRTFASERIEIWKPYENMERGLIPTQALAKDGTIGIPYYYLPDLRVVDIFGLTDATIARNPVDTPNFMRRIAHDRRPPPGYLEARGVNIRVHPPVNSESRSLSRAPFSLNLGVDLWMPFDVIYQFDETVLAKFPDHALSIEGIVNFFDLLERPDTPVIESDYDVYVDDNYVVYRKDVCVNRDSNVGTASHEFPVDSEHPISRFFLHVFPVNPDDLPSHLRRLEFENMDFDFPEFGHEIDGSCIAARRLPGYAIAAIRTGEFVRGDGASIWEGRADFVDDVAAYYMDVEEFLDNANSPAIVSDYDVYFKENFIVYRKIHCEAKDANMPFFLHLFPINDDDLPRHRRRHGFDNLDFRFATFGRNVEGNCIAIRKLPDHPISVISTGQIAPDGVRIWEGRFDLSGR